MTWLSQAAPWLVLLAVWPLLYALSLLLATLNYMRLRLRPAQLALVERAALAPESRAVLDAMRPELQALGFIWRASLRAEHPLVMEPARTTDIDLYMHHAGRAWALAHPAQADSPGHGRTVGLVEWMTCFADGRNWVAVNGQAHATLAAPPGWTYLDDAQADTASAWQAYARRLAGDGAAVVDGLDEVVRRVAAVRRDMGTALAAQGRARPAGPGRWRLTWREALRMAWRVLRGQQQLRKKTAQTAGNATPASPDELQARQLSEALGFEQQQALARALSAAHSRRSSFWITAALFLAVGSALFSWDTAWMLLAVIALHEGGHWLAMRWAGYQRQSVFFIPGLGGMATGEKADATPLQKVGVYLAGPVPGLLLGVGALAAIGWGAAPPPPGWVMQLLLICLLVNAFNLLPLTPLDGGRVVEALLFARLPVLRLVFALAGMGALGALAWSSRDPVIAVVAGVLLLGLPWQWRVMRLDRAVHRAHPGAAPASEAAAVRRLFGVLQQPAFAPWSFAQRAAAVRALLPIQQSRPPGWAEGAGGLLIYLACLALPAALMVGIYKAAPQGPRTFATLWNAESAQDEYQSARHLQGIEARLAQADRLPEAARDQRVAAYLEAAEELSLMDDQASAATRAKALYRSAWALTQARAPHDLQRAQALQGMAETADTIEEATRWRQRLLTDLQGAQGTVRLILADAQEGLAALPDWPLAQRLTLMQQAVENLRAKSTGLDDYRLQHAREQLARLLDASGYADAAQAQLHANVAALQAFASEPAPRDRHAWWTTYLLMEAEARYAWFLIDHDQASAAVALTRKSVLRASTAPSDLQRPTQENLRAWLWAAIETGDTAEVRQALAAQQPPRQARRAEIDFGQAQLAAAQMLGDETLRAQALATLQRRQARRATLCQEAERPHADALNIGWRERQRTRQREAARAAGLCEPAQ